MAIKRCPYCRSIIDEKDQYCNNCGTQLLFPEDEFIEEDMPGEKVLEVEESPSEEKLDEELILEEPEPAPAAAAAPTSPTFDFPEKLTGDSTTLPPPPPAASSSLTRDKDILEPVLPPTHAPAPAVPVVPPQEPKIEIEFESPVKAETQIEVEEKRPMKRTSAEMPFEEAFSSKPAGARSPASTTHKPLSPSATSSGLTDTMGQTGLSASSEEIEDIVRIMTSLGKDAKETTAAKLEKRTRAAAILEETQSRSVPDVEEPRPKTAAATRAERKTASDLLKDSSSGVPPWATGMRVEPPAKDKLDLPGLETEGAPNPASQEEPILDDFFSSIDKHADETPKEKPGSKSWADIPDREDYVLESLADRLGRERRERTQVMPYAPVRSRSGAGSKFKAKILDMLIIALCWAAAVFFATRILSVSVASLFQAAMVPLLLFLLTLGVAYFFLFLYFLGETLGDRVASS